jgi:hypothetical protein
MAPSVKVRLEVDGTPEAIAAIRQFTNEAKKSGHEASAAFEGFEKGFKGVEGFLGTFGIAIAAAEVVKFTKETIAAAYEQKHLAEQLGTTVGNMSALSYAARITNTDTAALSAGLGIFARRLDELKSGLPATVSAFARLRNEKGQPLSARDFLSQDTVVNFSTFATAISKVETGFTRTAIAAQIMGRNGRALIPVAAKLAELGGLPGLTALAQRSGFYVDDHNIAQFEALNVRLQQMKAYAQGATLEFLSGFGPSFIQIMDDAVKSTDGVSSSFKNLGESLGFVLRLANAVYVTLSTIGGDVLNTLATGILTIFQSTSLSVHGQFDQAEALINVRRINLVNEFKRTGKDIADAWNKAFSQPLDAAGGSGEGGGAGGARSGRGPKINLNALRDRLAEATIAAQEAVNREQENSDKHRYEQGLLSLEDYFAQRIARIRQDAAARTALIEHQQQEALKLPNRQQAEFEYQILGKRLLALNAESNQKLNDLEAELEKARTKANSLALELREGLTKALTNFFTDGISKAHDLIDAIRQLGLEIAQMVERAFASRLADKIVSAIPFVGSVPVKGHADGGLITGPGSGTSDSIPAWVSNGEYFMPANRVAMPGALAFLEGMRRGNFDVSTLQNQNFTLRSVRGYADGGLVGGGAAQNVQLGGQVTVALDDGLVLKSLDTPEGHRAILKVIGKNRRAVGATLR